MDSARTLLGSWTLRNTDCLGEHGLSTMPDKCIDHCITDPPYETEAHTLQRRVLYNGRRPRVEKQPLDFPAITPELRLGVSREIVRLTKGWVIVFCQIEAVGLWKAALVSAGAKWRRGAVWVKSGMPQLSGDRPGTGVECLAIAWAGEGRSVWNGGGKAGVWTVGHQSDGPGRVHPTQKPQKLMRALLEDFTQPDDIILDPFCGAASTGVACKGLSRSFIGYEVEKKYYEAGVKRLEEEQVQLPLGTASVVRLTRSAHCLTDEGPANSLAATERKGF